MNEKQLKYRVIEKLTGFLNYDKPSKQNMIGSPEVNKVIRMIFSPVLRENGFSSFLTRNNWGWHEHSIWVLNINSVGNYFSQVTGWPPMSIVVNLGVYYDFIPEEFPEHIENRIKKNKVGRLIPKEYECHARASLLCTLDQSNLKKNLSNPAETKRRDIWWVKPDGSNVEEVVTNIKDSFLNGNVTSFGPYNEDISLSGVEWFRKLSDLEYVFNAFEDRQDYYKAAFFAKHFGCKDKLKEYGENFLEEAKKIGGHDLKIIQKELNEK